MRYVVIPALLLLLGFAITVLSFFYKPDLVEATQMDWFASSGALMGAFGVVAEFIVSKVLVSDYIPGMVSNGNKSGQIFKAHRKKIKAINVLCLTWIIVGSLIWGYAGFIKI